MTSPCIRAIASWPSPRMAAASTSWRQFLFRRCRRRSARKHYSFPSVRPKRIAARMEESRQQALYRRKPAFWREPLLLPTQGRRGRSVLTITNLDGAKLGETKGAKEAGLHRLGWRLMQPGTPQGAYRPVPAGEYIATLRVGAATNRAARSGGGGGVKLVRPAFRLAFARSRFHMGPANAKRRQHIIQLGGGGMVGSLVLGRLEAAVDRATRSGAVTAKRSPVQS